MPSTVMPKPWHYPAPARVRKEAEVPRPPFGSKEEENLSGYVQGRDASAPEERLAKALDLDDNWNGYDFRRKVIAPAGVAGSIEIDFWAYKADGRQVLIKVDGDWIHNLPENQKKDKEDYDRLVDYCARYGYEKPIVIKAHLLGDLEMARQTLRDLG